MAGNTDDVVINLTTNVTQGQGAGGQPGQGGGQGPGGQSASGEAVAPPINPQPPGPGGAANPQPQQVGGGAGATGSPTPGAVGGGSSGTGAGPQGPGPQPGPVGGAHPTADFFADMGRQSTQKAASLTDPFMPKQAPEPTWLDFQTDFASAAKAQEKWHKTQERRKARQDVLQEQAWEETYQQKYGTPEAWDTDPAIVAEFENITTLQQGGKATATVHAGQKSWFFGALKGDVSVQEGETLADAEKRAGMRPAGQAYAYTNAIGGIGRDAMAISPTADLQMFGGLGNLGAQAGLMTGNPYLAAGGAAANILFGQLSKSVNYLYGKGTELAQLERYREMSRGQGVDLGFGSDLIKKPVEEMGFKPGEATWMAHGFYSGIGHGDVSKYDSTQAMRYYQRLGVGLGQQAHFLSLDRAQTGDDAQGSLNAVLGTGATMGLAGQGLEQFLSRIAAATEGMRDRGLQLDEKGLVSFAKALHLSSGEKMDPQRAAILATGLSSSTANLAQSMVGGFGGIIDASLMSASAAQGGDYFDVAGRIQEWSSNPTEVYKQLMGRGLSEDTIAAGFMGKGWSVEEARRGAKGGLEGGSVLDGSVFTSAADATWRAITGKGLDTSKALAKADLEVNTAVSNNTEAIKDLTQVMKKQQLYNVALGNVAGKAEGAWQDLNPFMADDKGSGVGRALLLGMSPHITALRAAWSMWSK